MGLLFKFLRGQVEKPGRKIDKAMGRTRCPNPRCRSANVIRMGKKWHCQQCGRDFK